MYLWFLVPHDGFEPANQFSLYSNCSADFDAWLRVSRQQLTVWEFIYTQLASCRNVPARIFLPEN